ncbi:MAG: EcoRV family type II restriction endonuclease [Defluviitaleaceae bacterium]|nr:EcoRV family type II restriction endonuclease [Defluviitaleaceae bacterium]
MAGNGVFAKAGEDVFDDYWINYGKIQIKTKDGKLKPMTSFEEYIFYRGLSHDLINK